MSCQVARIEIEKRQECQREKAKKLSLAFYEIYDDFVLLSKRREDETQRFSSIFKETKQYFIYLETCKSFIQYIIELKEILFNDKHDLKFSEAAEALLKKTNAIQWIEKETNLLQSKNNIVLFSLVSKLQNRNKAIKKTRSDFLDNFSSSEVSNVKNLRRLKSLRKQINLANTKNKIEPFINNLEVLFESVILPAGIKFDKIISGQYSQKHIEHDYFSIIHELLCVYQQESNLQNTTCLAELLKQISTFIINNQKKLKVETFSQFKPTHEHYIIKTLTTFALNDKDLNLTHINNKALNYFHDYKNLNNYLHYLDKLWFLSIPRENAKSLPDSNKQLIVDKDINTFLDFTFGESLNRIYHYFLKNNSNDFQLKRIAQKFIADSGLTKEQLKISIYNEVKKACFNFKSINKIPLSTAISRANSWSTFNRKKSAYSELLSRVILRLIINLEEDNEKGHVIAIERAIEEELCCIHRQHYFHYLAGEIFGSDFKAVIEGHYEKYRTDMFSLFKFWFCLLITQEVTKESFSPSKDQVDKYFRLFINHSAKAVSVKAFLNSDNQEESFPKVEIMININDESIDMCIDRSSENFLITPVLKDELSDNGIDIAEFEKFTSNKYLTALWNNILGEDTKELVSLTLLQKFIEAPRKGIKKGEPPEYLNNRVKFKRQFIDSRRGELFKTLNEQTFPRIIFNYNKSDEDKLKNKLEVVSQLSSLSHERYVIGNKLGQGTFGVVYRAKDLMFESTIAIKLIPHWFHSEDVSKRLIKEAAIMRNSQHENVVVIYDLVKLSAHKLITQTECKLNHLHVFDDNEDVFALIMEEVNGGRTLGDYLNSDEGGRLTNKEKIILIQGICNAVHKVHSLGITHGDIKPENILIDKFGKPKLTDFGIASQNNSQAIGYTSYPFASPNVINKGTVSFQDDIYSLGALMLYVFNPEYIEEFKGKVKADIISIKNNLFVDLLSLFIVFYFETDSKQFQNKFIEINKDSLRKSSFDFSVMDTSKYSNFHPILEQVIGDLFFDGEALLMYFSSVLKAFTASIDKAVILERLSEKFGFNEVDSSEVIFEEVENIALLSLAFGGCIGEPSNNDYKHFYSVKTPKIYGQVLTKEIVLALSNNLDFEDEFKKAFCSPKSQTLKIESVVFIDKYFGNNAAIVWSDKFQGPLTSYCSAPKIGSRGKELHKAISGFEQYHNEVINYLKAIKNSASQTKINKPLILKLMSLNKNKKLLFPESINFFPKSFQSCFEYNDVGQPKILLSLQEALVDIMKGFLSIDMKSRLTEVKRKKVLYNKTRDSLRIKTNKRLKNKEDTSDCFEDLVSQASELIKSSHDLININLSYELTDIELFYEQFLNKRAGSVYDDVITCINEHAQSKEFSFLLDEIENLYMALKKDWEYAFYIEYKNAPTLLLQ